MPGSTFTVQGLDVLFNIFKGALEAVNPIRSESIKHALPGSARGTGILARDMSVIGIGDNYLPMPIFHFAPLLFTAHKKASLDPEDRAERRCVHP
jgi:hypothetical protein